MGLVLRHNIDVTNLISAHVLALANAKHGKVGISNVGTEEGA